jgi:hypothetical protein
MAGERNGSKDSGRMTLAPTLPALSASADPPGSMLRLCRRAHRYSFKRGRFVAETGSRDIRNPN